MTAFWDFKQTSKHANKQTNTGSELILRLKTIGWILCQGYMRRGDLSYSTKILERLNNVPSSVTLASPNVCQSENKMRSTSPNTHIFVYYSVS